MNDVKTDNSNQKRKWAVLIYTLIVIICALVSLIIWYQFSRHVKRTSDAYVEGNQVIITPLVDGFVTSIHSDDTFLIQKGALLITLDETNALIALNEAKEAFANTVRSVCQIYHQAFAYRSDMEIKKAELIKAEEFYNHRYEVLDEGAVSLEDFQNAVAVLESSFYAYILTKHLYQKENAQIQGTTLRNNPMVLEAADKLEQAWVNYYRCKIYSPVEGLVAQRSAQVGMFTKMGEPLMSVIPLDQIWVNANFKETQMKRMRIGQSVILHADMYGKDITYHGTIVGLPGAAGNAFSILPPQNLSGNWIKIVQRLPVRVALDPNDLKKYPLRIGMTMSARVHLKDQSGLFIPTNSKGSPLYQTNIYRKERKGSKKIIETIFAQNIDPSLAAYVNEPYYPDYPELHGD